MAVGYAQDDIAREGLYQFLTLKFVRSPMAPKSTPIEVTYLRGPLRVETFRFIKAESNMVGQHESQRLVLS
jgi:hypothetical protein